MESLEIQLMEIDRFNTLYNEKFGAPDVPCYIMGQSLGGLMATELAAEGSSF